LLVSESVNGYDRIYLGDTDEPRRLLAKEMDATITRIGGLVDYGVAVVRHMNENLGIYSLQTGAGIRACANKWETTQTLSRHGIKQPVSMFAYKPKHVNFLINKVGGLPAIAKTLYGSKRKGRYVTGNTFGSKQRIGFNVS
jgi:ribosomal protein S6--L-glutamate ligase